MACTHRWWIRDLEDGRWIALCLLCSLIVEVEQAPNGHIMSRFEYVDGPLATPDVIRSSTQSVIAAVQAHQQSHRRG